MPVRDPAPRRSEVWLAHLDKVRPVIVLTRDPMGALLNSVIVAPVTSRVRGLSTEIPVGPNDGVRLDSVVNLDHLQLLPRAKLLRRVGRARPETMTSVCRAIDVAIDC